MGQSKWEERPMREAKRTHIRAALVAALATVALPVHAQDHAQTDKAKAVVESYSGHPSPFPVTEPLLKKPTGKKIAVFRRAKLSP